MLLFLITLNIVFIPHMNGLNSANVTSDQISETGSRVKSKPSTITIITEGGKVVTDIPSSVLSRTDEKSTVLLALDKELGNTNEKKPIKPRKGVLSESAEVENSTKTISPHVEADIGIEKNITKLVPVDKFHKMSTTQHAFVPSTEPSANVSMTLTRNDTDKALVVTEHVKKPRILVYDDLASDKVNEFLSLPDFRSSSKPALDQIQSPNSKLHLKTKGADPGMIIPIVITIVVVPAFAVLAFMAVKRGREAWRNRHYKRMDFLLDGMYND